MPVVIPMNVRKSACTPRALIRLDDDKLPTPTRFIEPATTPVHALMVDANLDVEPSMVPDVPEEIMEDLPTSTVKEKVITSSCLDEVQFKRSLQQMGNY